MPTPPTPGPRRLAPRVALALAALLGISRPAPGQIPLEGAAHPHWIWAPAKEGAKGDFPAGVRYFRRKFEIKENGSTLTLDVTADDAFTLYLDGKAVADGADWRKPGHIETKLAAGWHVLAAEVTNAAPGPAGFLTRGAVTPLGQVAPVHTDAGWKAADAVKGDAWKSPAFDDSTWAQAADLGPLGMEPWAALTFEAGDSAARFRVPVGFAVTTVAAPEVTGSVLAFAFDEAGAPCVSVERGPILRLLDADKDGRYEGKSVIAPQMSNCQGFNFLRGSLYAVGNGPQGVGIYRLSDADGDGVHSDKTDLVRAVDGAVGEHGPHAIQLGPDGSLYFNAGNHAHLKGPIDPKSPCNVAYEGELLPHYNDPRGHAVGIMAPGGEIYRSDDDGKTWSRVAQGFRNQYDFAFNQDGEIFTFDSDMEWDIGLPWYRPVRVNHAIPGAEFGWRNGSAPWPESYFDSLPATLNIGRGSPTGVTFYQARTLPPSYADNFLACDWSQGRILAISLEAQGATYKAKARTLVSGQPLNVTDIEVGPDGAVYFTTGGRQTLGGLYRVAWTSPLKPYGPSDDTYPFDAIHVDSPLSAFSRAKVARIKKAHEATWANDLIAVANDTAKGPIARVRALDLLAEHGPAPEDATLAALVRDASPPVRARAVSLLGTRSTGAARAAITSALKDVNPTVRRRACEALVRSGGPIPVEPLLTLLQEPDRWVRYAARIALEHAGAERVGEALPIVLRGTSTRAKAEVMLAMVRIGPIDAATQDRLISLAALWLTTEKPLGAEFLALARLSGLLYVRGPNQPREIPASLTLREAMLAAFESDEMFRREPIPGLIVPPLPEAARLLSYLGEPAGVVPLMDALHRDSDGAAQVHYANCLRNIKGGWTGEQKRRYWAWFDGASKREAGFSYLGYLDFMLQDFLAFATPEEKAAFFADAAQHPFPSRVLIRAIDLDADPAKIAALAPLYADLAKSDNPNAAGELRTLILEKLGQAKAPEGHAALRELAKADPDRRDLIARSLCNNAVDEDVPLLVAALESRDPNTTAQVVRTLPRLKRPEGPAGMRNLIRLAKRTGPAMTKPLNSLAYVWWAETVTIDRSINDFDTAIAFWSHIYREKFPDGPPLDDPDGGQNTYTLPQLISGVLQSPARKNASAERGRAVIARARCLDCHRLGNEGQGLGPDLTTVASRFRPAEILEAIAEPSKVISDQYRPIAVATTDGKVYNGMPAGEDAKGLVLLLSDATKVTIPKADIEERKESKVSVMPEGLINTLSYQDIADLLALFEAQPRVDSPKK